MSGPINIRCRNFSDEGVGECDSGEYCRFVHPGPRWANARPYINRNEFDHIPRSYFEGGGGGGARQGGAGGGNQGPIPRRCRFYEQDGTPAKGGCFLHPKGECKFTHPDQPGWDTAALPGSGWSRTKNSSVATGSNSLLARISKDVTIDAAAGSWTGLDQTQQSPDQTTPTLGWGQTSFNEPGESANDADGGGGWGSGRGGEETSHGWGADETDNASSGWGASETNNATSGWGAGQTNNTNSGWGAGETNKSSDGWGDGDSGGGWGNSNTGGWGSTGNDSGSGGGWGSASKEANAVSTTQPETTESNPPAAATSENAWGSSGNTWGSSGDTWGSSGNNWGTSTGTWGSSDNTRGSSTNTWGSADNTGWGSSNNAWGSSKETSQPEPASNIRPKKGKGREWGSGAQSGGWQGSRDRSNSGTATGPPQSSGGGWGSSTPSLPANVGVTRDDTHATPNLDAAPATMDLDKTEPNFEGKAILDALGNALQRRKNKRKRSHGELCPRYDRHLLAQQNNPQSGTDGDGDAVMDNAADRCTREGTLEVGEIAEALPCIEYRMDILSSEPETSEEKTAFAKHLLYLFADAAVAVDQSRRAEKRYEACKKSQEARMYNHPGHDARQMLVEKLQTLRGVSHEANERLGRVLTDLGSLPSHHLSDVIGYNERNHLTEEALAEETRRKTVTEMESRLKEGHDHLDQTILTLTARLDKLRKERQAREIIRDLSPVVDPNEMAVEEATATYQANVQRVVAVEDSLQTITSIEDSPHKEGPIQILEASLPNSDAQSVQLQAFAESIARLIRQVPVIKKEVDTIKAENEKHREDEKVHQEAVKELDLRLVTSSAQLETLNSRVAELIEGLKHEITIENVKAAAQPTLSQHTAAIHKEVEECIMRGLERTRKEIKSERSRMQAHIYGRLVGTQRLFEAVGGYLRSVRADLASLVDKDIGMGDP